MTIAKCTKAQIMHEKNFEDNMIRVKDGRFQVRLIFNDRFSKLYLGQPTDIVIKKRGCGLVA
jgi:hypothetical protein